MIDVDINFWTPKNVAVSAVKSLCSIMVLIWHVLLGKLSSIPKGYRVPLIDLQFKHPALTFNGMHFRRLVGLC